MRENIRADLLRMLRDAITAIKAENYSALAELSNHSIHNASIYKDADSLSTAVLLYTLSKILARCKMQQPGESFCIAIAGELGKAITALERDDEGGYHTRVRSIFEAIAKLDSKLKLYMTEVITQAQIKKGSRLYEHGFSLSHAAALLGITQWELQSYIGHTALTELPEGVKVQDRLKFARELFHD